MGFFKEFKEFAVKGNVVDMSIGVIIGGAFGKIVSSLVADVIMPPIGLMVGGVNFKDWAITLKEAVMQGEEVVTPAITLNAGNFLQTVFDFMIIALTIFLVVKGINKMKRKKEEAPAPAAPPEPSNEEKLLTEIRDLLKEKK